MLAAGDGAENTVDDAMTIAMVGKHRDARLLSG